MAEPSKDVLKRLKDFIKTNNESKDKDLIGTQRYSDLKKIIMYKIPITDKFYAKAEEFIGRNPNARELINPLKALPRKSAGVSSSVRKPVVDPKDKIYQLNLLKSVAEKEKIIDLLDQLRQLITDDLPMGLEIKMGESEMEFVKNENYDAMIEVLGKYGIQLTNDIDKSLSTKIKKLNKLKVPKKAEVVIEKIKEEEEEEAPKPKEKVEKSMAKSAQVIPPDQLDPNFIKASSIVDKEEESTVKKTGYDKYVEELVNVYGQLGLDFFDLAYDKRYKNMSEDEIKINLDTLRLRAAQEQAKNRSSTQNFMPLQVQTVEGPQYTQEEDFGLPPNLLVESLAGPEGDIMNTPTSTPALATGIISEVQSVEPTGGMSGPVGTDITEETTQSQVETSKGPSSVQMPFKERYHPESLKRYFENSSYPIWDSVLEKNNLTSKESVEERIKIMDGIIQRHGPEIFVNERKSDTVEELNELIQLQFSLSRPHLGNRIHQSVNVDYSQLNKIKSLANSVASSGGSGVQIQEEQISQIENNLGLGGVSAGGSALNVQSEEKYKFDIYYDNYLRNSSRNTTIPIKQYKQPVVTIRKTDNSIPGESRQLLNRNLPKGYLPKVATDFEF